MAERRLGRGLGSLLGPKKDAELVAPSSTSMLEIPVDAIYPNRMQPRKTFELDRLEELASSMQEVGLLTPILVSPDGEGRYELIAGERRWRAACQLGWETIRAQVRTTQEEERLVLALVENVQREDLNPIERALAYRELMQSFNLTHEQAAKRVGKSRSALSNLIRLLDLPEDLREGVRTGELSEGHARALLAVDSDTERRELAERIREGRMSVRATEGVVSEKKKSRGLAKQKAGSPQTQAMEQRIARSLGTKVRIQPKGEGGRIVIEYFSADDFQRLLGLIEKR